MAPTGMRLGRILGLTCAIGLALGMSASSALATANVLIMPADPGSGFVDVVDGDTVVVWGNTQFANGSAYTIDFGDGSPVENGAVTDRSFISTTHPYTAALNGTVYTASLTVGGETETVAIRVFRPADNPADVIREVRVATAIRNGLRSLYVNQDSRAANFGSTTTSWAIIASLGLDQTLSATSLAVLAFENHGFSVNDDPNKAIYQAVIQRGLNFIFDRLRTGTLTPEPAGDPCVAVSDAPGPCVGLATSGAVQGYATSIASFAVAGAVAGGAGANVVAAGLGTNNGGFVAGRTYAEILQRQINTIAWAQADSGFNRGGWRYRLDDNQSDGSSIGWAVLAMLDGAAAGATVPPFVATELATVIANTSCPQPAGDLTRGLAYTGCGTGNVLRTGIALQALSFMGVPTTDSRVINATQYVDDAWNGFHPAGEQFSCPNPSSLGPGSPSGSGNNKGCIYSMYQTFKGLLLNGVLTLPNAAALPPAPLTGTSVNWWREYQDYLVANQQVPTTPTGGEWESPQVHWSCCESGPDVREMTTALALLILSATPTVVPCAIVSLDPDFASNDLQGGDDQHTVVATVTTGQAPDCDAGPAVGVEVDFNALSGPNAGFLGSAITDTNGQATLTYTAGSCPAGQGLDEVQASSFDLTSEIVQKEWVCNQAPDCSAAAASAEDLWPPNHKYEEVTVGGVTDPDGDPVTITVDGVAQDEAINGNGDGNTCPDAELPGGDAARLRRERAGPGDGRVYHVSFTAEDGQGGECSGSVAVCVPHDQSGSGCVDQGPLVDSTSCPAPTGGMAERAQDRGRR